MNGGVCAAAKPIINIIVKRHPPSPAAGQAIAAVVAVVVVVAAVDHPLAARRSNPFKAQKLSHAACEDEFRRNSQISKSWSVFFFFSKKNKIHPKTIGK